MPSGGREKRSLPEIWAILLLSARHNLARVAMSETWELLRAVDQRRLDFLEILREAGCAWSPVVEFTNSEACEVCRVVEHET